jgi:hypothetical protein
LIGAETGIKTIAAAHGQCRLWVISGQTIAGKNPSLSALVQKRTKMGAVGLFVRCQQATSHGLFEMKEAANSKAPK